MRINWEQYTLIGKFFIIISLINSIGIVFGYVRVLTLGEPTWYSSTTNFWFTLLFWLSFTLLYISVVIITYGYVSYWKRRDRLINFYIKIGFISLILSGFLFYIIIYRMLIG